jgi:hypothetical protein
MSNKNNDSDWEDAGPAELNFVKKKSSIFSMRIPRELLSEITRMSRARNVRPTVFARQALELGLAMENDASLDLVSAVFHQLVKVTATSVSPVLSMESYSQKISNTFTSISSSKATPMKELTKEIPYAI